MHIRCPIQVFDRFIAIQAMAMTTMAAMMAATMLTAGCGNGSYTSKSVTNTDITTVQDSGGNDYEVSHITKNVNGNKSESYENVPLEIYNESPVRITGLYMTDSDSKEWGDNWMVDKNGNDVTLEAKDHAWGETINYSPNRPLINVKVDTDDGKSHEFKKIDITKANDPEHINFVFSAEKGSSEYTGEIQ